MNNIDEILQFNNEFVKNGEYKAFPATKYPKKKLAILSCMDTRLTLLLPAALGLKNGDVKIIKNAGALICHPYGSTMRSILVCIYELGVEDIFVIGHYDCGVKNLCCESITEKMLEAGINTETIEKIKSEVDFEAWLTGFECVDNSIIDTVNQIKNHPLIPSKINVIGLIMDPQTGKLNRLY